MRYFYQVAVYCAWYKYYELLKFVIQLKSLDQSSE